jgi:DNA-binding transcriptional ArsR family regulator
MVEENFVLVSLKDDEAKKLAQVISNDTSRKILDFLATCKHCTETDIAKHMRLPLSTVHYNLQALVQAKLVQTDEFHYSSKGKEVNHYALANKYVIIAPAQAPETLRSKLRKILPVALICVAAAGLLKLFTMWQFSSIQPEAARSIESSGAVAPMAAPKVMDIAVQNVVQNGTDGAIQHAGQYASNLVQPNLTLWFLYGALFAILVFIIVDWIQRKK